MKITKAKIKGRLDIREFPLTGLIIEWECPKCGKKNVMECDEQTFVSFTKSGGITDLFPNPCGKCNMDVELELIINVDVKINTK